MFAFGQETKSLEKKNQENQANMIQFESPKRERGIHRKKHERDKKTRTWRNAKKKKIAREKRRGLNNLFFIPDALRWGYFLMRFARDTCCCTWQGKNSCLWGRRLGV